MRKYRKAMVWIVLGLGALLLRALSSAYPQVVETYYSHGFFQGVRWVIDTFLAWSPVPLIYLFFGVLLIWLVVRLRRWLRRPRPAGGRVLDVLVYSAAFLSGGVFFFLFLWGFNYARPPLADLLGLQLSPLPVEVLKAELEAETAAVRTWRARIPGAGEAALGTGFLPDQLEDRLRDDLKHWLQSEGFPTPGRVRGRLLYPRGVFLRFSSAGLYWPFTGEGHADAGLHPLQLPTVIAHEMGHGYGFGDEGDCNFLGYVACVHSEDPFIAYAGHLDHWRTLAANYRRYEPEAYQEVYENLPAGVRADLAAIYETMQKYPDIMPRLRDAFYDNYLKVQGIEEGMKNYNRVVMLVRAWREGEGDRPDF